MKNQTAAIIWPKLFASVQLRRMLRLLLLAQKPHSHAVAEILGLHRHYYYCSYSLHTYT